MCCISKNTVKVFILPILFFLSVSYQSIKFQEEFLHIHLWLRPPVGDSNRLYSILLLFLKQTIQHDQFYLLS